MPVLSGFKFFAKFDKMPNVRVFIEMASKLLFCISDISDKVRQSRVERRLLELHSMLHCRDNCQSI